MQILKYLPIITVKCILVFYYPEILTRHPGHTPINHDKANEFARNFLVFKISTIANLN